MMLENNIYSDKKELFEQQLKAGLVPKEATAFIRDTKQIWNNGCYFGGESKFIVKITYNELVDLKSSGNLIAGTKYRIIDYETLTSQPGIKSAGHPFDIVVTALDSSTLDENARAMISKRDVDGYFSTSKLNAWKIKYSLNNNKDRFTWTKLEEPSIVVNANSFGMGYLHAFLNGTYIYNGKTYYMWNYGYDDEAFLSEKENPSVGDKVLVCLLSEGQDAGVTLTISQIPERQEAGKGIIYHMIDEYGNECPYDFKNIKFYHDGLETDVYTFTWINENSEVMDSSIFGNNGTLTYYGEIYGVYGNVIKPYMERIYDEDSEDYLGTKQLINRIAFISDYEYQGEGNEGFYGCYNNSFGNNCYNNSFGNRCNNNSFGNDCIGNSFGNECNSNSFRLSASKSATKLNYCCNNHFDDGCSYNVIWNSIQPTSSNKLQNINVVRGVSGTSDAYNFINVVDKNAAYEIKVEKNLNGDIIISSGYSGGGGVSEDYVNTAIANAITTTLNTAV